MLVDILCNIVEVSSKRPFQLDGLIITVFKQVLQKYVIGRSDK